ncbi:hypothetical protein [Rubrivirga sp.]|uniref:hypothetical protein n=1 Tax=Rubrivirga sp. TaxID=1885344 RepID=UPI003C7690D7
MVREPVPFRVLLQSGGFFEEYASTPDGGGEPVPPASVALSSEAEEEAFLDGYPRNPYWIDGGGPFYEPFPDVDYAAETAVVVALGTAGSGSVLVRVDSVVSDGRRARVFSTTVLPCLGTRDVANPAAIVALQGERWDVRFEGRQVERQDCTVGR